MTAGSGDAAGEAGFAASSAALARFVAAHAPVCVLTGAGLSAASGIPTYRAHDGRWQRAAPVQAAQFARSERARQRYWLRSLLGWPAFAAARPNDGHRALAALQAGGRVGALVTQNVDGLHQRAGSTRVVELHGRLDAVRCLACSAVYARAEIQDRLENLNAGLWRGAVETLADGDARPHVDDAREAALLPHVRVPACSVCGGLLKPTVVFFGDNIAPGVWAAADAALAEARGLLVVGSSLGVYSGLRMVRRARAEGMPVVALNRGWTRGDDLLLAKYDLDAAPTLAAIADATFGARPSHG